MSTLSRPKSPHTPTTIKKGDKEDSFWDKFSTLGRKRGTREGKPIKQDTAEKSLKYGQIWSEVCCSVTIYSCCRSVQLRMYRNCPFEVPGHHSFQQMLFVCMCIIKNIASFKFVTHTNKQTDQFRTVGVCKCTRVCMCAFM